MEDKRSFWRKFNPTLKEMTEKNPKLSILGIWWAWYWRLVLLSIAIGMVTAIIFGILAIGLLRG